MKTFFRRPVTLVIAGLIAGLIAGMTLTLAGHASATGARQSRDDAAATQSMRRAVYTPRLHAQADVKYDGTYSRVVGFTAISHPYEGYFCLRLPKSVPSTGYVAMITPDFRTSWDNNSHARWDSAPDGCPSTRWVGVMTWNDTTPADEGFSIVIP